MDATTLLPQIAALLATGLCAGFLGGLLGVGGGIVIVPVLEFALQFIGVPPEQRMHVAVATSLATIIPTSISSARAHHRRGALDASIARSWGPAMLVGALGGSLLATQAPVWVLTSVFGVVALAVAVKMALPLDHVRWRDDVPRGAAGGALSGAIGMVSAMMGIGSGTISVPTMTLLGTPIHRAVGTAAFFGLLVSIPGTLGYLFAQPEPPVPGWSLGLVSLLGVALIAPGALLTAPLGARVAHALSPRALSFAFGLFLLIVAARMLYRSFTA
jgi:uncharacterized membrane protein YfcA